MPNTYAKQYHHTYIILRHNTHPHHSNPLHSFPHYAHPHHSHTPHTQTEFSEAEVSLYLKADEPTMLKTLQNKLKVSKKLSVSCNFTAAKQKKRAPFILYR